MIELPSRSSVEGIVIASFACENSPYMRVSYSDGYYVPLPEGHPFPMAKFPALRDILVRERLIQDHEIVAPRQADWTDLRQVHTNDYLSDLANGSLSKQAERRMGLPWSKRLVYRSRLAVQGTINAAFMALEDGVAGNLAGGTHHAMPGHGEGFCVLNDVGVAIRILKSACWIRRTLIIDLDVHQGNGNAAFFDGDDTVYTFSMHGAKNYPFKKPPSTLDVPLEDDTGDQEYLDTLESYLPNVLDAAQPDLVFYLGGIDVMADDRYGRMSLSRDGLHARDGYVLEQIRDRDLPVVLLLSGGYAESPATTADLHATMHREAARVFRV
jgi:acetoin utilization deacetylase AcuC-like enzyme